MVHIFLFEYNTWGVHHYTVLCWNLSYNEPSYFQCIWNGKKVAWIILFCPASFGSSQRLRLKRFLYSLWSFAKKLWALFSYYDSFSLRKHAYSNILKILPPKSENFKMKNSNIFHISDQNIDFGYSLEPPQWGSSNEYPQSIFFSINKKNNVYPCKPQFYYIKRGSKLYRHVFVMLTNENFIQVKIFYRDTTH